MAYHSKSWIAALAAAITITTSTVIDAADISVARTKVGLNQILIEGRIENGDYERFIEAVLRAGVDIDTVSLATGGGDALEAMRVGRLIRAFGLSTEAPKYFPQGNVCIAQPKNQSNCRCDSACLFLFLGGIKRYGDAIGVHRVYLNRESQLTLSLDESKIVSRAIEIETKKYFDEMGAPASLLEQVNSAASDSVKRLTTEYAEQNLYGYSRDMEEWLIARCGSANRAFDRLYRSAKISESENTRAEYKKVTACFDHHLRIDRLTKFRPVLTTALAVADMKILGSDSLIDTAKASIGVEMPDIIGMRKSQAVRVLASFGLGLVDAAGLKAGEGYILRRTLTLSLSASGQVSSIGFGLSGEQDDKMLPFTGFFLNGLGQESKPEDFVAKFGKPWKQGLMFGGNTGSLWLEGENYDSQLIFEIPDNKLRAVRFNKPGYWRNLSR